MSSGYRRCVAQVGRHLRGRREHPRERLLVRLDDGVVRVHHVERHLAGVGVDDDLDRVAHVVEVGVQAAALRHRAGVGVLRVGVVVRRRVGVLHPVDVPADQDRVRVGVEVEERRRLGHPGLHAAVEHETRVVGDLARDEEVDVVEADGEHHLLEEGRELDPAVTLVVGFDVGAVGQLVVDLGLLGVGHHVPGVVEAEVDRRLGDRRAARRWRSAARSPRRTGGRRSDVSTLAGETIMP